jgi:hypothetical protein
MKINLSHAFQEYFKNAIISVEEDTYAAVYATTPRKKAIVSILELDLIAVILMVKNCIKSTITRLHCYG